MSLIKWSDEFSVNIKIIDKQHQKLINIINKLHEAMRYRKTKEILGEVITKLIEYTGNHFTTEEEYFEKFGYPGTALHIKEHQKFMEKVCDFNESFNEGGLFLSTEIMNFLENWLITHIKKTDKQYGPFFNENGLH